MTKAISYRDGIIIQPDIHYCLDSIFLSLMCDILIEEKSDISKDKLLELYDNLKTVNDNVGVMIERYVDMFEKITKEDIKLIAKSKNKTILEVKKEIKAALAGYNRECLKNGLLIGLEYFPTDSQVHQHAKVILEKLDFVMESLFRMVLQHSKGPITKERKKELYTNVIVTVENTYVSKHGRYYD